MQPTLPPQEGIETKWEKKMDVDVIVTLCTHDFSPSLTFHIGGGYGLHPEWI